MALDHLLGGPPAIRAHGLKRWWKSLEESERQVIAGHLDDETLWEGEMAGRFLGNLVARFRAAERPVARKVAQFAYPLTHTLHDPTNRHFALHDLIELWYRSRNENPEAPAWLEKLSREQIALAKTVKKALQADLKELGIKHWRKDWACGHSGYERLCQLLEQQGRAEEAHALAREAAAQGWQGNWDRWA